MQTRKEETQERTYAGEGKIRALKFAGSKALKHAGELNSTQAKGS